MLSQKNHSIKTTSATTSSEANSSEEKPHQATTTPPVKTSFRVGKYTIVGLVLAGFNFCTYTLLSRTFFSNNNEMLWLVSIIACLITTILGYILHSHITWRERNPGKTGIIKFFIWNILLAITISPLCTQIFKLFTPIYQLAFNISSFMHLPFDYEFIEATGVFGFTAVVTMILNFLFYDRIVFEKP